MARFMLFSSKSIGDKHCTKYICQSCGVDEILSTEPPRDFINQYCIYCDRDKLYGLMPNKGDSNNGAAKGSESDIN